jgi:hypothetical protein
VRKSASIRNGAVYQELRVFEMRGICRRFLGEHVEADFGRGQILAETVMEFAGDATPLFILYTKQFHGKAVQRGGTLLDQGLQGVMRTAERIFGGFPLPQMVANFVLPATRQERAPNRADQRNRP